MEPETTGEDLERILREAAGDELVRTVEAHASRIDARQARLVLKNPYVSGPLIALLAEQRQLASAYDVRRDVVLHPLAPRVLALDWIGGLFWPDLVRAGRDPRLHPTVRRAAELRLIERLVALSLGEKTAIARSASAGVLASLRHDPSPRVVAALLENPLLTEPLLLPLLASESASPRALATVAASSRWSSRYAIRLALVRNPRTPLAASLPLVAALKKRDLAALATDPRLDGALRQRGRLLSGVDAGRAREGASG
ncbi:MAG: hypothetical protein IPJ17_19025 [Holophagales bacterium]|nr:MAG: hypothetical protein IPJ17_19025 [Holophagales bacterium]